MVIRTMWQLAGACVVIGLCSASCSSSSTNSGPGADGGSSGSSGGGSGSGASSGSSSGSSSSSSGSSGGAVTNTLATFTPKFELSTQITGWQPDSTIPYQAFDANDYTTQIDGEAAEYTDAGMIFAALQTMDGANSAQMVVTSMDFGTPAKAQGMVAVQVASANENGETLTPIPNWPQATVTALGTKVSITVYAAFGQYYFELALSGSGYGSQAAGCSATACADISLFLTELQTLAQ